MSANTAYLLQVHGHESCLKKYITWNVGKCGEKHLHLLCAGMTVRMIQAIYLAGEEVEGLAAFRRGVVEVAEVLPCLLGAEVGVVGPVHQEGVEVVVDPWLLEVVEAVGVPWSCHREVGVVVVGGPWTLSHQ